MTEDCIIAICRYNNISQITLRVSFVKSATTYTPPGYRNTVFLCEGFDIWVENMSCLYTELVGASIGRPPARSISYL